MSDAAFTLPTPAPLHSAQWFRVAGLRPRLDPHAVAQRHVQRGELWHTLQRADGQQSFRLNAAAWAAIARCDGQRTLQAVWDIALAALGEHAPTQDELLDMLARLHRAGLMSFDRAPDFGAAAATADASAEPATERNTLLAWRIPLGRPDAWLTRLLPLTRGLFTPLAALLWTLAVAIAALAAWAHADELGHALARQLGAPHLLLWAALIYPLMKALHELAHGLAARHAGAAVPGWGISLLMGVPTPYVDASAASALPLRHQRLTVAAAGMALELALAAAALALWLLLQDGLLRELALLVVSIGAVSSLAVNANPLLRFDGYHLLCDALDLPNLAERSRRHGLHALRQRLLGPSDDAPPVQPAPGEAPWLCVYAPAALLMRWAVLLGLVSGLGALSWPLGAAAAALGAWSLLVQPLIALWRWLQRVSVPGRPLRRRAAVVAGLLAVPLLALPLPDTTVAPGVLWLPEHALVRAQADGVVDAVLAADGQAVRVGDPLLRLRAPQRDAELVQLSGRIEALQSTWLQALRSDAAAAVTAEHQLQTAQAALAEAQARAEQLTVRATSAGRLAWPHAADLPGRFVARGALLAHVITGEPGLVRVAIAHEHAAQLRAHPGPVAVRTADALAPTRSGQWSGRTSGAGALLPSAALGEASGGSIATDPADAQGLRPARPVVLADVPLQGAPLTRIGERAWVRFEHGHAPLAWQALRAVQQQVLGHFNPGA